MPSLKLIALLFAVVVVAKAKADVQAGIVCFFAVFPLLFGVPPMAYLRETYALHSSFPKM